MRKCKLRNRRRADTAGKKGGALPSTSDFPDRHGGAGIMSVTTRRSKRSGKRGVYVGRLPGCKSRLLSLLHLRIDTAKLPYPSIPNDLVDPQVAESPIGISTERFSVSANGCHRIARFSVAVTQPYESRTRLS